MMLEGDKSQISPGCRRSGAANGLPVTGSTAVALVLVLALMQPVSAWEPVAPPEWLKDLVVYHLTIERFTSPEGAQAPRYPGILHSPGQDGSGRTQSLLQRLDYLDSLSVTGLLIQSLYWYQAGDEQEHPFGSNPYRIDLPHPRHGSAEELRTFIEAVHQKGMRVIMGIVPTYTGRKNPFLAKQPDWFVTDLATGRPLLNYRNPEFVDWWVQVMVRWAMEYGVDGFRVDGPDWSSQVDPHDVMAAMHRVAVECERRGKRIAIIVEGWRYNYHLRQRSEEDLDKRNMGFRDPGSRGRRFEVINVSTHDSPAYRIQGSRFRLGYCVVFGRRIPLLFMGEEFNATRRNTPLPIEDGHGLMSQWLDWRDLGDPERAEFLQDARRILGVRRNNRDLLHYDRQASLLTNLEFSADTPEMPVPYARFVPGVGAIIVAGNHTERPVRFEVTIPLVQMGLGETRYFRCTDLWTQASWQAGSDDLRQVTLMVPGDRSPGGGVRAIRIDPLEKD
jgi:glycosidase